MLLKKEECPSTIMFMVNKIGGNMAAEKIAVLVSGGLDSFVMYHYIKKHKVYGEKAIIDPVFINYHGRYTEKELGVVSSLFGESLKVFDKCFALGTIEQEKSAYIPNRNLYMLAFAAGIGYDTIALGGLFDDNVGDKCVAFYNATAECLSVSLNRKISVIAPFSGMTKSEVVSWYLENFANWKDILDTTSCYHPHKWACKQCPSCFRRNVAFFDNKIRIPFVNIKLADEYYERAVAHDIPHPRELPTIKYVEWLRTGGYELY